MFVCSTVNQDEARAARRMNRHGLRMHLTDVSNVWTVDARSLPFFCFKISVIRPGTCFSSSLCVSWRPLLEVLECFCSICCILQAGSPDLPTIPYRSNHSLASLHSAGRHPRSGRTIGSTSRSTFLHMYPGVL